MKVSIQNNAFIQNAPSDTYAAPAEPRALLFSFTGATLTSSTVTLEVTGTHTPRSTGPWFWLDGINVLP